MEKTRIRESSKVSRKLEEDFAIAPANPSENEGESSNNESTTTITTINRKICSKTENDDSRFSPAAANDVHKLLLTEKSKDDGSSCSDLEEIDDTKSRLTAKDWLEKFKPSSNSSKACENESSKSSSEAVEEANGSKISKELCPMIPKIGQNEILSEPNCPEENLDQLALDPEPKGVNRGGGGDGVKKPALSFQERYELKKKANQSQKSKFPTSTSNFDANLPALPPPSCPPPPSNFMRASEEEPQQYQNLLESVSSRREPLTKSRVPPPPLEKEEEFNNQKTTTKNSGIITKQVTSTSISPHRPSPPDQPIEQESLMREMKVNETVEKWGNFLKPLLLKGVENLTIQDVVTKNWDFVKSKAKKEVWSEASSSSCPANLKYQVEQEFESISVQYSALWKFFDSSVVSPFEQTFAKNICLSNEKFEQIADNYRNSALDKIPQKWPQKIQTLVLQKLGQFINDYRARNQKIQRMEDEFGQLMLSEAGRYYNTQMLIVMGETYCDSKILKDSHDEIYSDTFYSFREACSFKNLWWTQKYDNLLQDEINKIEAGLRLKNDDRKIVLEGQIMELMSKAKQFYHTGIQTSYTIEEFRRMDTNSRVEALKLFDQKTKSSPSEIVGPVRSKLENCLDKLFNDKNVQMLVQQKQQQQSIDMMQQQKTMMTIFNPNQSQFPSARSMTRMTVPGNELEQTSIAIHVGLHRTKIGYVDTQGQLHVMADVQNCVYFDGQRMVTENSGDDNGGRKKKSFCGDLMKNDLGQSYWVKDLVDPSTGYYNKDYPFRIEQLLSFLLVTLKWEAELELKRRIVDCLIVIPQSLNDGQRKAVRDAATLAGFNAVDLINDTSAMALSYVMNKNPNSSQIITANLFEGYLDAASFRVDNDGSIECVAISGDVFMGTGFWWMVLDTVTLGLTKILRGTEVSLSERAKKIFSMKELRAEDNSPSILAVPDDFYDEVRNQAPEYGDRPKVDSNYALMGAAYLLCIGSSGVDNHIYKKWLDMTQYQVKFQVFKDKLLLPGPGSFRKSENKEKGRPMSSKNMQQAKNDFFLQNQRLVHEKKLEVLTILQNLHSQTLSCDETMRMDAVYAKLLDPKLGKGELETTHDDVRNFYHKKLSSR